MLSRSPGKNPIRDKVVGEMSVEKQAQNRGFQIVGKLRRYEDPVSKRFVCYLDEAGNEYILYRGVLTIIATNGKIF